MASRFQDFAADLEAVIRASIVSELRNRPDTTIGDLLDFDGEHRSVLRAITIGELMGALPRLEADDAAPPARTAATTRRDGDAAPPVSASAAGPARASAPLRPSPWPPAAAAAPAPTALERWAALEDDEDDEDEDDAVADAHTDEDATVDAADATAGAAPRRRRIVPPPPAGVDTRTEAGRAKLDQRLFELLQQEREPIGAEALVELTGATPLQVRTSLHRLVDAGRVERSGQARGTRYQIR